MFRQECAEVPGLKGSVTDNDGYIDGKLEKSTAVDSEWLSMKTFLDVVLFLLPSDNVQHDLQQGSLIAFPKEENPGNKRKPIYILCVAGSGYR